MGKMKEYYHEYLTAEDFDYMFDDEYEMWLENKRQAEEQQQEQYEAELSAYEEALGWGK